MKPLLLTLVLSTALAAVSTPVRADDYPIKTCVVTGDAFGGDLGAPIDVKYKGPHGPPMLQGVRQEIQTPTQTST